MTEDGETIRRTALLSRRVSDRSRGVLRNFGTYPLAQASHTSEHRDLPPIRLKRGS